MALYWCATDTKQRGMISNYIKIAFRNLTRNKAYSFINITGLAIGMMVVMFIGFWIWDELSYDKYHENHSSIAMVLQTQTGNGKMRTGQAIPYPMGNELREHYAGDFKHIVMSSWTWDHILTYNDKKITQSGTYMEQEGPEMLTLKMLNGTWSSLRDPSSILLSQSVARSLFGDADPMGKIVKIDNAWNVKVTGIYEDLPHNTTFRGMRFVAPWALYITTQPWIKSSEDNWGNSSFQLFVQLADHADIQKVSEKIRDIKMKKMNADEAARYKPAMSLQSMDRWHLYSRFQYGVSVGGAIQYVWMLGIIGAFVLLLACINFMNLSTARSEKRAREVGVRKAVGSLRGQLITQFFSESLLVVMISFLLALILVKLLFPFFNQLTGKEMTILWSNPVFWLLSIGFCLLTGFIAGSYPAFYLSSFRPVKILKGTFKAGRTAAIPRKVLIVFQFTVSVVLIIGTIVVFKQVQHARNRETGYDRTGLVSMMLSTRDLHRNFSAFREEALASGAVKEIAESSSPTTGVNSNSSGFEWPGKDPDFADDFATIGISPGYGKTVGWQFKAGRDFSSEQLTDSAAVVLNEAAVKYMGLKGEPVGQIIRWTSRQRNGDMKVIGVIKDMLMQSPYDPVKQTIYYIDDGQGDYLHLKLNPQLDTRTALAKLEIIVRKYAPSIPFDYSLVDNDYAGKFSSEVRIGKLVSIFTVLTILISCLGLFAMASFMAEQRVKEIGVRKVLGASVFSLWRMLSKDFMVLVLIALVIATPLAYYFTHQWLLNFHYHSDITWWIFAVTGISAMLITILTISFQALKAARTNPVKSLRTE